MEHETWTEVLEFNLNGKDIKVTNPDPECKLAEYLRNECGLTGTKIACGEGGCGSCTVVIRTTENTYKSINSCITPLCAMHGLDILTVEGIGSKKSGFHPIQTKIAELNGTQCGFCTPGWVMNLYALLQNSDLNPSCIEKRMDGNLCRCTGYRPILDACKSFSTLDIEDLVSNFSNKKSLIEPVNFRNSWYRPMCLEQGFGIIKAHPKGKCRLFSGFTSFGVTKYFNKTAPYAQPDVSDVKIDITSIKELNGISCAPNELKIGSAVTISALIQAFEKIPSFESAAKALERVASTQIRNTASWAGNIVISKTYRNFPSDIAVLLIALKAQIVLMDSNLVESKMPVEDYLTSSNQAEIILHMIVPFPDQTLKFTLSCQKVALRSQNCHAHVNSAIAVQMAASNHCKSIRIAFGGETFPPTRCIATENVLKDSVVNDQRLQEAFEALEKDLKVSDHSIVSGLLFKSILQSLSTPVSDRLKSIATPYERPVSKGTEGFVCREDTAPVSMAITKESAKLQASGEVKYLDDEPAVVSELHGAIVFSTIACGVLKDLDATDALKIDGVVDFVSAADIPGKNCVGVIPDDEQLFVSIDGQVKCVGAALGLILATSQRLAQFAASKVKVTYVEKKAVLTLEQAIAEKSYLRPFTPKGDVQPEPMVRGDVEAALASAKHVEKGRIVFGRQHHFYLEPQGSIAAPGADPGTILIKSSTQDISFTQERVARVLGMKFHHVDVSVNRVGGAFGGKLTRSAINAAAAAVACEKHGVQVRVINDRNTDFHMTAGREGIIAEYSIGFDSNGVVSAYDLTYHVDCGYSHDLSSFGAGLTLLWSRNAYYIPNLRATALIYATNLQTCTAQRAPIIPQVTAVIESAMDRVAMKLGMQPEAVRERNFLSIGQTALDGQEIKETTLPRVWESVKRSSDFAKRHEKVKQFNLNNAFRKRGLALIPVTHGLSYTTRRDSVKVDIFANDGSVVLTHGGCEIGQGIHTKAIQAAAYALKIPMDLISIRPTCTDKHPNAMFTGGSCTSESVVRAVLDVCNEFNKILDPLRVEGKEEKTWPELIALAHGKGINLSICGQTPGPTSPNLEFDYFVHNCTVAEVELDIITGETQLLYVEMNYDCGISLNPSIDIGQIEGGFIMTVGNFLHERVTFDEDGRLTSAGTWDYKIPGAQDIPQEMKITLLDNPHNITGVLSSKASGEPSMASAGAVYLAIKNAISAARQEHHNDTSSFDLDLPATTDRIQQLIQLDRTKLKLSLTNV